MSGTKFRLNLAGRGDATGTVGQSAAIAGEQTLASAAARRVKVADLMFGVEEDEWMVMGMMRTVEEVGAAAFNCESTPGGEMILLAAPRTQHRPRDSERAVPERWRSGVGNCFPRKQRRHHWEGAVACLACPVRPLLPTPAPVPRPYNCPRHPVLRERIANKLRADNLSTATAAWGIYCSSGNWHFLAYTGTKSAEGKQPATPPPLPP